MKISALVLSRNEEDIIEDCLKSLNFVDEIIVLDQNSSDKTRDIAEKYTDKVITSTSSNFSENRNKLLSLATNDWVLYVDCDEIISKELSEEIKNVVRAKKYSAFYIPRKNYVLGKRIKNGGWWPDYAPRLFNKAGLIKWVGVVHESPQTKSSFGYLKQPIEHFTARTLNLMLDKSIKWAKIEAQLFFRSHNPKVNKLKIIKAGVLEFLYRYLFKKGFLDGTIGLMEAIYQSLHKAMVFTYLWEMQNNTREKFNKIKKEI